MKRVLVLGSSGSGKSTLARKLGALLEVEVVHLDSFYWQPNWVATPAGEWQNDLERLLNKDSWVMDGNYVDSLGFRLGFADTVVFIDLNRLVCLWRCVKRRVQNRGRNRQELALGCYEKIDWDFFKWIWNYPRDVKPRILELLEKQPDGRRVFRLRGNQEVLDFLEKLGQTQGSQSGGEHVHQRRH